MVKYMYVGENEYYNETFDTVGKRCSVCGCVLGEYYPYSKCTTCLNQS